VARVGELRNAYYVSVGGPEGGKNWLEDVGVDCGMVLEWILGRCDGRLWTGFVWLGVGTSGGPLWAP